MIIDTFMFFNEFDILEGRLEYLYNDVDYFVLVESNMTHSGEQKPLHYLKNMSRYKKYLDKILYFPFITSKDQYNFDRVPTHDRDYEAGTWHAENAQRNHIGEALKLFDAADIVMISDVDEIPHRGCIDISKDYLSRGWEVLAIQQDHYCYNFNQKLSYPWHGTVVTTNSYVRAHNAQHMRNIKHSIPFITNGGWHLTYWGTAEAIQEKIKSFAHQELNIEQFTNLNHIKSNILEGKNLYGGSVSFVPADRNLIDQNILNIFGKIEDKILNSINKDT